MAQLDATADSVSSQPVFNQVIPGLGKSLNGLLNSSGTTDHGWGDLIKLEQATADYFNSFDPASLNFNPANIAAKPAILGLHSADGQDRGRHAIALHRREYRLAHFTQGRTRPGQQQA